MEFVKMMVYLEAQLNQDKTFMDRFLDENMIKSKKFKRACQNRSRWLNWYCQAKDDVLKDEFHQNLTRCEKYLDKLCYYGYSYNELKKKYSGNI